MEPPEGTGRTTKTQTTQARNQLSAETPSMPREAGRRQVRTRGSALGRSDVTVTRRPPAPTRPTPASPRPRRTPLPPPPALRSPVSLQERASIPGSMAAEAPGACPHVTRPRSAPVQRTPGRDHKSYLQATDRESDSPFPTGAWPGWTRSCCRVGSGGGAGPGRRGGASRGARAGSPWLE